MDKYVQYGCGWSAPSQWINFDASPTLRFEKIPFLGNLYTKNSTRFPSNVLYGDIVKGLPVENNSCDGIYACHVLEHLSLSDFRVALKNTLSLLKPNGVFRLVVPDLKQLASTYMLSNTPTAAHDFMGEAYLGYVSKPKTIAEFFKFFLGNSQHLWMWDFNSIKFELLNAGFVEIREYQFGENIYPFVEVE